MREYKVMASSLGGTCTAGKYVAETAQEAIQQARAVYVKSPLGRRFKDVGGFQFYIVDQFSDEATNE